MRAARQVRALTVALFVAGALVGAVSPSSAQSTGSAPEDCDWPMWGNRVERDFSTACSSLNTENAKDLRRIWFFNTRDVVTATPAVVGDTVVRRRLVGQLLRARIERRTAAVDVPGGAAREGVRGPDRVVGRGRRRRRRAARCSSAPARRCTRCAATDGELRWKHELGADGDDDDPTEIESSPVVVDGAGHLRLRRAQQRRAASYAAGVIAFDAEDGRFVWERVLAPTEGDGATGPGAATCGARRRSTPSAGSSSSGPGTA